MAETIRDVILTDPMTPRASRARHDGEASSASMIGFVAQADVAKRATPEQTGEVVEKISN